MFISAIKLFFTIIIVLIIDGLLFFALGQDYWFLATLMFIVAIIFKLSKKEGETVKFFYKIVKIQIAIHLVLLIGFGLCVVTLLEGLSNNPFH